MIVPRLGFSRRIQLILVNLGEGGGMYSQFKNRRTKLLYLTVMEGRTSYPDFMKELNSLLSSTVTYA